MSFNDSKHPSMEVSEAVTCSFIRIISPRLEQLLQPTGYSRVHTGWAVIEYGKPSAAEKHKFPAYFFLELFSTQHRPPHKLLLRVTRFHHSGGEACG